MYIPLLACCQLFYAWFAFFRSENKLCAKRVLCNEIFDICAYDITSIKCAWNVSVLDGEAVLCNLHHVEAIIEWQRCTERYDSFKLTLKWEIDFAIIKQTVVSFINDE